MSEFDKKFKSNRVFAWAADGHRLTVYLNGYMNVPVRADKFKDYIAAGLETLAEELRAEAAKDRGRFLQRTIESENADQPLMLEEEKTLKADDHEES